VNAKEKTKNKGYEKDVRGTFIRDLRRKKGGPGEQ